MSRAFLLGGIVLILYGESFASSIIDSSLEYSFDNIALSRTPNGFQYTSGNIEESNRIVAKGVQDSFIRLIKLCQKEAELPLFTIVVTVYLEFLKFIKKNYDNVRIQMDKDTLNSYYTIGLKETADYIFKTSASCQQKIYKKMVAFPDGTYSTNPNEVYNVLMDSQMKAVAAGGRWQLI